MQIHSLQDNGYLWGLNEESNLLSHHDAIKPRQPQAKLTTNNKHICWFAIYKFMLYTTILYYIHKDLIKPYQNLSLCLKIIHSFLFD